MFLISSTGLAFENHPSSMGVYVWDQKGVKDSPVYKKPLMEKYLFLAETGNWMVSSNPKGKAGNLFQESGSFHLPLEHAEWFSATTDEEVPFQVDRTLTVSPKEGL